ncbi:MAG: ParA family protein, partial [Gammaproteobacteria bacterium]|nr:ParA family protein [Gammaproteobacteria bacterium]
ARLMLNLNRLRALRDRPLREWVLLSRFLPRRRLAREVAAKVALHFRDRLLATEIPEAAVLAECAGSGKTIFEYRRNSPSARAFESLADDLIHGRVVEDAQEAASHVA